MARTRVLKVLRILVFTLLVVVLAAGGGAMWLAGHYKQIIRQKLPAIVLQSTDSIYHISFSDVHVGLLDHTVTITNLNLSPDTAQAGALRKARRRIPPTLSTVFIPRLEAAGIAWKDLISDKSLDCVHVSVQGLKWTMICTPHPQDTAFTGDKKNTPGITRVTAGRVDFSNPDITYNYIGPRESFSCHMRGGTAGLNNWIYNYDMTRDTSAFLYAQSGHLRLDSFILRKKEGRYVVKKPLLDFESTPSSVTLKNIKLHQLTDHDPASGNVKEIYDLHFPSIELRGFNWNKLIADNQLLATKVTGQDPDISLRYLRENESTSPRMGSYPSQLLLQVGIHTHISNLFLNNGHLRYVEVTKDKQEGVIEFTHIRGSFSNITNIDSVIRLHKDCVIKLEGKFGNKSPLAATFDFRLTDTTGHFTMNGTLENLDGDDVIKQVQAFTFVEVTSFHLSRIDMQVEGDEHYGKGNFTMLYNDLKISLFKFKSKMRKGRHGPFSFLGSALVLYPSNPMPRGNVRTCTTFFDREPDKGFISLLWRNIYRGAKKTAVRHDALINLTDGKEDEPGQPPHRKSFLNRLFHKNK